MEHGFDPFYDYDEITDEMVDDFASAMTAFEINKKNLLEAHKEGNASKENLGDLLKSQEEVYEIYTSIKNAVYTMPAMVHIAGPKKEETNPDDEEQTAILQRCKRCGSVLAWWVEGTATWTDDGPEQLDEDQVPWWAEDDVVAKAQDEMGIGMYIIEDRELEKHERECVSLEDLVG